MEELINKLEELGQSHLLKFYDELTEEQKAELLTDMDSMDLPRVVEIYRTQIANQVDSNGQVKPRAKIEDNLLAPLEPDGQDVEYRDLRSMIFNGLSTIMYSKVAVLLLAGGQGTRLGVDYPKGMYDIGLPSHESLFEIQAKRIKRIRDEYTTHSKCLLPWYIMTSKYTTKQTKEFFEQNDYFGLDRREVIFFEQGTMPCFDFNGKILLEAKHKIAKSPDGNGGVFEAMHKSGVIEDMKRRGTKFVHMFPIDNVLVRIADPKLLGYQPPKLRCNYPDVVIKVVEKTSPDEAVGTVCLVDGRITVIEYSELPEELAKKRDPVTGKLLYNCANICDQLFHRKFLEKITPELMQKYHIAIKKIPHIDLETGELVKPEKPNGIKLEKFIFDAYEFSDLVAALMCNREDEFSPLKNADTTSKDNPTTALKALKRAEELGIFNKYFLHLPAL